MSTITDFKDYCDALHSGKTSVRRRRAELIRYLRDWMIRVQSLDEGKEEEKLGYVSNYEIFANALEPTGEMPMDELSRIVENVKDACRRIGENFRSKILREVVLMPSHRARELDSTGVQWLACRSGRTIREKLAYTNNKLRAVRRRFSLDTGENRLFMAFLRRAKELIEFKGKSVTKSERQFLDWSHKFLYDKELDEIRMWGNTAPNNTLLSDKYYRTVWRAWQALEKLDDIVTADDKNISSNMCIAFFWKLLQCLSRYCRFCAQPVLYDYSDYVVKPWTDREKDHSSHVVGLSATGYIILDLDSGLSKISVETGEQRVTLKFNDVYLSVSLNGKKEGKYAVSVFDSESNFSDLIKKVIDLLHLEKSLSAIEDSGQNVTADYIYMDVFSVRPIYLTDSGKLGCLPRVLWQTFDGGYELAADEASAIYVSDKQKMHSIRSCMVDNSSKDILLDLFRIIRKKINGKSLSIPLPDAYNVFQTEPLRRVAHMNYKHAFFAPKSIAIVVYALSHRLLRHFSSGDFVIVVDCNLEELSLTLIQGKYNEMVYDVLPTSKGYVWERHPTVKEKLVPKNETIIPEEIRAIFGERGLIDETEKLSFDLIHSWISIDNQIVAPLKNERTNIENVITKFKSAYRKVIGNHNTFVILASPQVSSGQLRSADVFSEASLFGLRTLMNWEQILSAYEETNNISLPHIWSEHLPSLAIKRLYGSFSLIGEGNQMEPLLGKSQSIPIPSTFVLPKNQSDYRFGLIMGNDKEVAYEAVLRHRAFPLHEDVECNLDLTYTYGRDNPYELIFSPKEKQDTSFSFVKVTWERAGEFPYENLLYPLFPLPSNNWTQLEHGEKYSKREKRMAESNYLEWVDSWSQNVFESKRHNVLIGENEWFLSSIGNWMCIKKGLNIEGKVIDIAFFQNQFCFRDSFAKKDMKVSFSVKLTRDGKYSAADIVVEDNGTKSNFSATDVVQDNSRYNRYNIKAHVFFPLHHIYANGMTSHTPGCPNYFLNTVQKLRDKVPVAFDEAAVKKDFNSMRVFFRIMCIMAKDFGNSAYGRILNVLMDYPQIIDEDCGCALGDYDLSEENQVLNAILGSKLSEEEIIGILGKAAWKSDGFIKNMRPEILLKYYDCAVDYLAGRPQKNGLQEKSVLWCLEYILAVFRLREKKIDFIDWRLSLNDEYTKKLADTIEDYIKAGVALPYSRVKMELRNTSEEYSNIPTLMYAILVYINGGEDEIIITEISEDIDD